MEPLKSFTFLFLSYTKASLIFTLMFCSVWLKPFTSPAPTHILIFTRRSSRTSTSTYASPYFTDKCAARAIMLLQFGPSHYRDGLVRAVKTYYPCLSNPCNWLHIFRICKLQAFSTKTICQSSVVAASWKLVFRSVAATGSAGKWWRVSLFSVLSNQHPL